MGDAPQYSMDPGPSAYFSAVWEDAKDLLAGNRGQRPSMTGAEQGPSRYEIEPPPKTHKGAAESRPLVPCPLRRDVVLQILGGDDGNGKKARDSPAPATTGDPTIDTY